MRLENLKNLKNIFWEEIDLQMKNWQYQFRMTIISIIYFVNSSFWSSQSHHTQTFCDFSFLNSAHDITDRLFQQFSLSYNIRSFLQSIQFINNVSFLDKAYKMMAYLILIFTQFRLTFWCVHLMGLFELLELLQVDSFLHRISFIVFGFELA